MRGRIRHFKRSQINAGKVTSGDAFGTRAFLKNNYLYRMAAAILGIYGNSKDEAMYPLYYVDAAAEKLDASKHSYTCASRRASYRPFARSGR